MALSLDLAVVFPVVLIISLAILGLYTHVEAYMDELFHVPQAQHYCNDQFHVWNQGITTYPGLYWFSFAVARAMRLLVPSAHEHVCSAAMLRSMNVLLSSALPILAYRCRVLISPLSSDAWVVALIIFLYPLNMFYYYLYYTDTLSTVSLVLTYWYTLKLNAASNGPSFLQKMLLLILASVCIMARQTNAVWLLFLAGTSMLHHVSVGGFVDDELSISRIFTFVMYLWKNKGTLWGLTWPLLLPVLAFVGFVLHTGSIVLGDKDNHQPVLHFAMLSHSLFLLSAVVAPLALLDVYDLLSPRKSIVAPAQRPKSGYIRTLKAVLFYLFVSVVVGYMLVAKSYGHPFLESDNRHYMFYLWKRYLSSTSYRLLLCPMYALGACLTFHRLRQQHGPVWVLIFLVALTVTLVPTPLLEPRYFTPGVVMALLNMPQLDLSRGAVKLGAFLIVAGMAAVNVVTIFVFLYKPFVWEDGTVARFMY